MTDIEIFDKSLRELKRNIEEGYQNDNLTFVVTLSRKGPRLMERLFHKKIDSFRIITEYALPFLFWQLAEMPSGRYKIMIVDDAVYYGSTLEGIYRLIMAYKKIYRLENLLVEAYTAIMSQEAKMIEGLDVVSYHVGPIRPGYGHFFARNVIAKIRELNTSMEVDFPTVHYRMSKSVDIDVLFSALNDAYPGYVYKVETTESKSVNLLLTNINGAYFNKIRMFAKDDEIRLTVMTPMAIVDEVESLRIIFEEADERITSLWNKLFTDYIGSLAYYDKDTSRSIKKMVVALANYLLSFNTILGESVVLKGVFSKLYGDFKEIGIRRLDIQYLTGIGVFSKELYELLNQLLNEPLMGIVDYQYNISMLLDTPVFESIDYPDVKRREELNSHNMHMIRNSMNLTQALSAIFFNQMLLLERWSRDDESKGCERLYFGYTYHFIMKIVERHARFSLPEDWIIRVNQWVDKRIDQGCIVPQYVVDATNGIWTRVFRPGENEDVVLSHLARWVLEIYNIISKVGNSPLVYKDLLSDMLSLLIYNIDELQMELPLNLRFEKENCLYIPFFLDESGSVTNLLEYMRKMNILTEKDGYYSPSGWMTDNDIRAHSTLSAELTNKEERIISSVINEAHRFAVPQQMPFLLFNYHFRKIIDVNELKSKINNCATLLQDLLFEIEKRINKRSWGNNSSAEKIEQINQEFKKLLKYTISIGYLIETPLEGGERLKIDKSLNTQLNVYRLNLVLTIINRTYFYSHIKKDRMGLIEGREYYKLMHAEKIWDIVNEMVEKDDMRNAYQKRELVFAIRSFINTMIQK